jgi:NAD(P)-dependent dehydrogenase (short-subunit alcohol dehydrogenase family)
MTFAIDLEGRRALVTGSGQGIGRAIALTLAQAGAAVVVNDFVADRAEAVADQVRERGGSAEAAPFDVTDFGAVAAAFERIGGVDILVNNAGNAGVDGFALTPFTDTLPADWDRYFGVNLFGVMNCTRAALPTMIDRAAGRVVTIISDAGRWGEPRMAPYAAAKAGAAGFTRSIAREVGRHGITVNNIALGSIDTTEHGRDVEGPGAAERVQRQLRSYVVPRLGRPDDVAGLVAYLVSPLASWITGQTYPLNGGYTVNQ